MITDAQTRLLNAAAITAAGTLVSNSYDTGAGGSPAANIGRGQPLRLKATAGAAFVGGTGLTLNYVQSDNPDLSTPDILGTKVAGATPAAGSDLWDIHLPQNTKRYVGVTVVSTGTYTAGNLSVNIVSDTRSDTAYPANTGRP
jgi:hypothetical protein